MTKKELLNNRPLMPKLSLVGYCLCLLISIALIVMGSIVLAESIKFKEDGVEIEASVVDIVENDTMRQIYITYEFEDNIYEHKELKYWNDELDIGNTVIIKILKSNPEEITGTERYDLLAIFIFLISFLLIFLSVKEFFKVYSEENRIYKLLTEGEKQEGVIVSCEQVSERNVYGTLPWCITATINDKVYNGCKNYIKFSLKGAIGYLVDIYIDKFNEDNFYIDLISMRRKDENNKVEVTNNEQ